MKRSLTILTTAAAIVAAIRPGFTANAAALTNNESHNFYITEHDAVATLESINDFFCDSDYLTGCATEAETAARNAGCASFEEKTIAALTAAAGFPYDSIEMDEHFTFILDAADDTVEDAACLTYVPFMEYLNGSESSAWASKAHFCIDLCDNGTIIEMWRSDTELIVSMDFPSSTVNEHATAIFDFEDMWGDAVNVEAMLTPISVRLENGLYAETTSLDAAIASQLETLAIRVINCASGIEAPSATPETENTETPISGVENTPAMDKIEVYSDDTVTAYYAETEELFYVESTEGETCTAENMSTLVLAVHSFTE